jgi:hypothetical protein
VENNSVLDAGGSAVNFGSLAGGSTVNVFYGIVSNTFDWGISTPATSATIDFATTLESISWTSMVDGSPAGTAWMTPGAPGSFINIAANQKPVLAIMNAVGPGSLTVGSQVAVLEGSVFTGAGVSLAFTIESGNNLSPVLGVPGSIQMVELTPVPEPTTFALLAGLFGLGFVMWRRRK